MGMIIALLLSDPTGIYVDQTGGHFLTIYSGRHGVHCHEWRKLTIKTGKTEIWCYGLLKRESLYSYSDNWYYHVGFGGNKGTFYYYPSLGLVTAYGYTFWRVP